MSPWLMLGHIRSQLVVNSQSKLPLTLYHSPTLMRPDQQFLGRCGASVTTDDLLIHAHWPRLSAYEDGLLDVT